jgi:hypothetical protein
MSRRLLSVSLLALVWGFVGASRAEAFVYGHGENIMFLADLPANSPARQLAGQFGANRPTKLGYKYWCFHICWASLWTSSGEFVAYDRDVEGAIYFQLGPDANQAALAVGMKPEDVTTPFLYRFPLGWWIYGPLTLILILGNMAEQRKKKAAGNPPPAAPPLVLSLLSDERYQNALAALNLKEQSLDQVSTSDIERGVDLLVEKGIPRPEAVQNLGHLLEYLRNQQQPAG